MTELPRPEVLNTLGPLLVESLRKTKKDMDRIREWFDGLEL